MSNHWLLVKPKILIQKEDPAGVLSLGLVRAHNAQSSILHVCIIVLIKRRGQPPYVFIWSKGTLPMRPDPCASAIEIKLGPKILVTVWLVSCFLFVVIWQSFSPSITHIHTQATLVCDALLLLGCKNNEIFPETCPAMRTQFFLAPIITISPFPFVADLLLSSDQTTQKSYRQKCVQLKNLILRNACWT